VRFLLSAMLLGMPLTAIAQPGDPFSGFNSYPQFRNLSGLSGSGYGVDIQGYRSLSGPVAFSTPVAHTLGRGQVQIVGGAMSFDSTPQYQGGRSNGSAAFTVGATLRRLNIAGTFFVKSGSFDQIYNAQIQYIPDDGAKWIFSLGAQDIEGRGGAAGESLPEDELSSQSFFGVVTYRWDTARSPIYVSAGFGTRRYGRMFGSISHQILKPLRLWAEADGYSLNYGVTGAWRLAPGRRGLELTTTAGMIRGQYFVWSVGLGF
jgi:hypothetical protein